MGILSKKNDITMWFNTELFCINGKPLKFHVEGCGSIECHSIAKIVEAYGGKLSEPSADTILFSNAVWSTGNRQYYNLKYFHDSIIANQALELEKYKLPPLQRHHRDKENANYVTHSKNSELQNELFTEIKQEYPDQCSADGHDLVSTVEEELCTSARTKPFTFTKKRTKDNVEHSEEKKSKKIRSSSIHKDDSMFPTKISDRKDEASLRKERSLSKKSISKNTFTRITRPTYTEEENKQMVQYLIDNDGISRANRVNIWREMIRDLNITRRSAQSMRCHYQNHLKYSFKNYTDDVTAHKKFEKPKNFYRLRLYTDEENRKIMQYLIDKTTISRARGGEVWKEMKRDEGLTDRSPESLERHFWENLIKKYEKYTEKAEARKEFEELLNQKNLENSRSFRFRRACHRWTEEENQLIMDWLIDNDVIHRAKGLTVWKEAAEELKLNHRPTVPALVNHFRRHLLVHYGNYTSDPKVLKKFKALNIREGK